MNLYSAIRNPLRLKHIYTYGLYVSPNSRRQSFLLQDLSHIVIIKQANYLFVNVSLLTLAEVDMFFNLLYHSRYHCIIFLRWSPKDSIRTKVGINGSVSYLSISYLSVSP